MVQAVPFRCAGDGRESGVDELQNRQPSPGAVTIAISLRATVRSPSNSRRRKPPFAGGRGDGAKDREHRRWLRRK